MRMDDTYIDGYKIIERIKAFGEFSIRASKLKDISMFKVPDSNYAFSVDKVARFCADNNLSFTFREDDIVFAYNLTKVSKLIGKPDKWLLSIEDIMELLRLSHERTDIVADYFREQKRYTAKKHVAQMEIERVLLEDFTKHKL